MAGALPGRRLRRTSLLSWRAGCRRVLSGRSAHWLQQVWSARIARCLHAHSLWEPLSSKACTFNAMPESVGPLFLVKVAALQLKIGALRDCRTCQGWVES